MNRRDHKTYVLPVILKVSTADAFSSLVEAVKRTRTHRRV